MPIPTLEHPFMFRGREKPPALKNDRTLTINKSTGKPLMVKSPKVQTFNRKMISVVSEQYAKAGFDIIPEDQPVLLYFRAVVYLAANSKATFPRSDLDNMLTTVQEVLQGIVISDDRQIVGTVSKRETVPMRELEHFTMYVFVPTKDIDTELMWFIRNLKKGYYSWT